MASSTMSVKSSAVRSFTGLRPSLRPVQAAKVIFPASLWASLDERMLTSGDNCFTQLFTFLALRKCRGWDGN